MNTMFVAAHEKSPFLTVNSQSPLLLNNEHEKSSSITISGWWFGTWLLFGGYIF